jgi:hypothetical protein
MDWVGNFWATPAARAPHNIKFGAGQSSDGLSKSQPAR